MKGATAEPCASTSKPPSSTLTTMIGNSQNLRRASRKRHIWTTKSIFSTLLEHVAEAVFARAGRLARHPVAAPPRLEAAVHGVAAGEAHDDAHRREHGEEDQPQHHRADDAVEERAEAHPGAVE